MIEIEKKKGILNSLRYFLAPKDLFENIQKIFADHEICSIRLVTNPEKMVINESKRAYNNATVRDKEMKEGMDRYTGDMNEFWEGRDYLNDIEPMKAALLMSHGFNDWNVMPEHSYRIYKKAKEMGLPAQIYYHQYGHGGPPPGTARRADPDPRRDRHRRQRLAVAFR